jgi:hypothetical protein
MTGVNLPVLVPLTPAQKGQSKREEKEKTHLETSHGHAAS